MAGITVQREDGEYQWIPEPPAYTITRMVKVGGVCKTSPTMLAFLKRERYQWGSPIRCIGCGQPVPFFDAFDLHMKRSKVKMGREAIGTLVVGVKVRQLMESTNPAMQGKLHHGVPLHIMTWMVMPQTIKGPGCKACQQYMMRVEAGTREYYSTKGSHTTPKAYIDITSEIVKELASHEDHR